MSDPTSSPKKRNSILGGIKSKITQFIPSAKTPIAGGDVRSEHHLGNMKDVHPDTHDHLVTSLEEMVEQSGSKENPSVESSAIAPATNVLKPDESHPHSKHWFERFQHLYDAKTLEKIFASEHIGNFVRIRGTDEKIWETMPLYVRVGMHILFRGPIEEKLLRFKSVEDLLKQQSVKQGKVYNEENPAVVVPHIKSFVETYKIDTNELLQPNLTKYKSFNEFFSRKLLLTARPLDSPEDPTVITSAADSRLTAWNSLDDAKKFWIKGKSFTLSELLGGDPDLVKQFGKQPSLVIFRLAPQDYHRFHAPFEGTLVSIKHIPGEYYTVNPQAITENFDVFGANRRDVALLHAKLSSKPDAPATPVAFVAVGAMLVGSIGWSKKVGESVKKGEDLGFFQYGGSTCIVVFPEGKVKMDEDLVKSSKEPLETLVKVGEHIGKAT